MVIWAAVGGRDMVSVCSAVENTSAWYHEGREECEERQACSWSLRDLLLRVLRALRGERNGGRSPPYRWRLFA